MATVLLLWCTDIQYMCSTVQYVHAMHDGEKYGGEREMTRIVT